MTIDEAIEHAEEMACGNDQCAKNHAQLADWLRELKEWKKLAEGIDLRPASLMKPFQPNVNDLERENAKLREYAHTLEAANLELTSRLSDYIGQYDPTDAYVMEAQAENVKLRELVKAFWWCTENFDMPCKCDSCQLGQSDKLTPECEVRMRELGIEVQS